MDAKIKGALVEELKDILSVCKSNGIPIHEVEERISGLFKRFGIIFNANGEVKVILEHFYMNSIITDSQDMAEMIWENRLSINSRGGEQK